MPPTGAPSQEESKLTATPTPVANTGVKSTNSSNSSNSLVNGFNPDDDDAASLKDNSGSGHMSDSANTSGDATEGKMKSKKKGIHSCLVLLQLVCL